MIVRLLSITLFIIFFFLLFSGWLPLTRLHTLGQSHLLNILRNILDNNGNNSFRIIQLSAEPPWHTLWQHSHWRKQFWTQSFARGGGAIILSHAWDLKGVRTKFLSWNHQCFFIALQWYTIVLRKKTINNACEAQLGGRGQTVKPD